MTKLVGSLGAYEKILKRYNENLYKMLSNQSFAIWEVTFIYIYIPV